MPGRAPDGQLGDTVGLGVPGRRRRLPVAIRQEVAVDIDAPVTHARDVTPAIDPAVRTWFESIGGPGIPLSRPAAILSASPARAASPAARPSGRSVRDAGSVAEMRH